MSKEKEIDFSAIFSMTEEQQQQAYYTLAKRANQRFRDIANKSKLESGAVYKAEKFLIDTYGRTTFKQTKQLSGIELKENLKALERFYNSKTATAKGIRQLQTQKVNALESTFENKQEFNKFKKNMKNKDYKKKFFDFLSSQQFKTLSKYADSNQIIEDFTRASDEGYSMDAILDQYQEFLQNDMTFEEVAERRAMGGQLLH